MRLKPLQGRVGLLLLLACVFIPAVSLAQDVLPPEVYCPDDITVECARECGTLAVNPELVAWFQLFSATDDMDTDLLIEWERPACFPLGTTPVVYKATDDAGNMASCTAYVTVEDNTAPEIHIIWNRYFLWPPNHKMVFIFPRYFSVTDDCCEPQWVLESIESNEPDNGKGDGNTVDDIQGADFETADNVFRLRSERSGKGNGRRYTIVYRAWDCSGNTSYHTSVIHVPHDRGFPFASAAYGFAPDGTGFNDDPTFTVVLYSRPTVYGLKGKGKKQVQVVVDPGVKAEEIDVDLAYIGNTADAILPVSSRLKDVNGDDLDDLILTYDTGLASDIPIGAWESDADGTGDEAPDGYLGLHFVGQDGTPYLVTDVFALGAPITLRDDGGRDRREEDGLNAASGAGKTRTYNTDLTSIFPNPFNPATKIRFSLAASSNVTIAIYDVRGALVSVLVESTMPAGEHTVDWQGLDDAGRAVSSGVYFARMIVGDFQKTRKMVLLK